MSDRRGSRSWALAFLLCTLWWGTACAHRPPAYQAGEIATGRLFQQGQVWILELSGSPAERGQAAGRLVGAQIRWLLPRYVKRVLGSEKLPAAAAARIRGLAAGMEEAHRRQIAALARSAGVDEETLLAANLATEVNAASACSCLATLPERSEGGQVRLARNLDWPGGDLLAGLPLVVVERGPKHSFASFTWPGLVGVVTGMNDRGLSVADLMAYPGGRLPIRPGVPVLFAVRSMLERAGTVDEALAWLKDASRTMPQNYALADPGAVRTVETGPAHFRPRALRNGLTGITNFYDEDTRIRADDRYQRMLQAAGADSLSVARLQAILAEVALGQLNVQAVILEPASRRAWFSARSRPAAKGPFATVDLSPWLAPKP